MKAVAGWSGVYDFVDEYYRDPANAQHVDGGTAYLGCADLADAGLRAGPVRVADVVRGARQPGVPGGHQSQHRGRLRVGRAPELGADGERLLKAKGTPVTFLTTNFCGHALAYGGAQVDVPALGTVINNTIAFFQRELGSSPSPRTVPAPLPPRLVGPSVVTATSTCAPPVGSGITYDANVVYGTDFGNPIVTDVYRSAAGGSSRPAVVLVHGGGHVGGDRVRPVGDRAAPGR